VSAEDPRPGRQAALKLPGVLQRVAGSSTICAMLPAGRPFRYGCLIFVALASAACAPRAPAESLRYPPTPRDSVVDDDFGTRVADPHRWLEDMDSPSTADGEDPQPALYVQNRTGDGPRAVRDPGEVGVPPDSTIEAYVRGFDVSRIDSTLSPGRFDSWLRGVVGDQTQIAWEVNDCGETWEADVFYVFCLEADCELPGGAKIVVSLMAGNSELGMTGVPDFWYGEITGLGPSAVVLRLGQLREGLREARSLAEQMRRAPSHPLDDSTAIAYAKHLSARALSDRLPDIPVGRWVDSLAAGVGPVTWKVDGWDRVRVSMRPGEDIWASVVALFENSEVHVVLRIRVGTFRKGIWGSPQGKVQVWNKWGIRPMEVGDLPRVMKESLR
jgi:hypothetical protein